MSAKLTKECFDPYLYDTFEINFDSGEKLALQLVEIADESKAYAEVFSLIFQNPQNKTLPQHTYVLTHHEMGEVVLFLVPIAPGKFQALFNRVRD